MKKLPEYEALKQLYDKWLEASSGWMKKDLESIGELTFQQFQSELYERFSVEAEFGTGGLRSKIRAGINGINDFWIKRICKALRIHSKKIVIAYDTRRYSKKFAIEAANTLSAGQTQVFLFEEPVPTPLLSFAVKHLNCDTGIVITASHNPKEYNGFKLYDENGVQYIPDKVNQLNKVIKKIPFFEKSELSPKPENIEKVGETVYQAYFKQVFEELKLLTPDNIQKRPQIQVIYTPLHGTGARFVPKIMTNYGIDVQVIQEQMDPDPDFSTVEVPNPEVSEVFKMALKQAEHSELKPQALIATDPDADRLGVFLENRGEYLSLTGNELGILFTDFILRSLKVINYEEKSAILKTIVTTDAVKPIAEAFNLLIFETLTGFKFLGNKSLELNEKGINTLFSFEESYGYLYGNHAGDKDACSTAGLLALLLLDCGSGSGVFKRLDNIRAQYGFYLERLVSFTVEGLNGLKKLKEFMYTLRTDNPLKYWEDAIVLKDYLTEKGELNADVVECHFLNGDRVIFRPSGTELKIKAYINVHAANKNIALKRLRWMEEKVKGLFDSNLK